MEALKFLRFWKPSCVAMKENQTQRCCGSIEIPHHELDEEDDSFIDLELPLHHFNHLHLRTLHKTPDFQHDSAKNDDFPLLPMQNDHFSKRKILPIDPTSKPQSPLHLLNSAPKFGAFTLNKSKSMANTSKTCTPQRKELIGISMETPRHEERSSSKDLIQKYLNIIKYVKISKKSIPSDKAKVSLSPSGELSKVASPATVYPMKGVQGSVSTGVCKQLVKSRSASYAASPINRKDDSLLLRHDAIESAILHCKKSFNSSSAESSWLSRCTSDSSKYKLSNASSSTDSSLSSTNYKQLLSPE
ncbi:putative membrane-associated kinase regulator 5 -like protein [Gossypium arboreum]|uniref:Membrane-associated kinase regulator 5 isoform X1 n=3 Tax=Gossypium TaxID=3633 RepID=A0A1U8KCW1_GOSHI|nr:membrane-associated kinase regulator 5 isoform X1 [Gossypium hirsutum]XP_017621727.1 membrane-associated kinase regulator 5-like isoform X1 [Gossypium arboreum]KAG4187351.1 hypothetical protein ERO13_A08G085300v2 [Gossypium hirsutum]KHG30254.1 putative membrane-associated kinase regulator 5 -like protein [Gossypium arboreum]TYI14339.1 hypothetical protein ES332_A08G114600v1 [Gossypium tomentosum]